MYAELTGKKSHGIIRLLNNTYGVFIEINRVDNKPIIINKTTVSRLVNGNGNSGILVSQRAVDEGIKIAKKNGIAVVGTYDSFGTSGALGYYVEKIAKKDLIGLAMAHCSPFIAPFKARKPLFGTNPIAVGFPHEPEPLIIDISPAATTYGEIANCKQTKKPIPTGVAIDTDGDTTTDPD